MVDFPRDESLMPVGLDAWPSAQGECPSDSGWLIREERLEARLNVGHFRLPPDHREPDHGIPFANQNVPCIRFPAWHYCHHCGGMERISEYSATRERCQGRSYPQQSCEKKAPNRRPFLIPVRFVAVCEAGHIQDFPFLEWTHRDSAPGKECKLRMRAGRSSAGLSGITLECSCGAQRSLADVFRFDDEQGGALSRIGCFCKGLRPWLGEIETAARVCGGHLRVLQRGASNVYFPHVVNSIYLPLWAENTDAEVVAVLEQPHYWAVLSQSTVNGKIDADRCSMIASLLGVKSKVLQAAAQRKLEGHPSTSTSAGDDEEDFRRSEYGAICDGKVGPQTELYVEAVDLQEYEPDVGRYFSRIQLVHKLRETRALVGFTRILPPDGDLTSPRLQKMKLDIGINWLPAIKVYGEGIFVELDPAGLDSWLKERPKVVERVKLLDGQYNAARASRQQPARAVTAKFLLIHTLAHVLINQLSFDCGYGSASLRERIYCDFRDRSHPMHGFLIYTASGDSEGTMGGLVRQGRPGRLEVSMRRALEHAAWCSSDPVCIERTGQGPDNASLAACHGCCLLPETSCEEGNRLLDRALLTGTLQHPEVGFFGRWLRGRSP